MWAPSCQRSRAADCKDGASLVRGETGILVIDLVARSCTLSRQLDRRQIGEAISLMSRIVRVEVGRFDYELVGDFKFFKTPFRPTVLLCLTDDDGVQGWGQSVPVESWTYETVETVETTCATILRRLFSAQTRLILRTFTDAWTARSGRHSPSVSRFAKLLWTLRATTSGASKLVAACTRYWEARLGSR